jgi:hypothetical protein
MTKDEVLKQLLELHAIQGSDGCWDRDDYMLGLYNGLELALSIVENRECRYKQRPKSQPEQEPVKDWVATHNDICALLKQAHDALALTSYLPQGTWVKLTNKEFAEWDLIFEVEAKLKDKKT